MVQLALTFEPPKFDSLLACIRHVVETCGKQPKTIAMELDLSPSQFSMMLSGYEGRHFPAERLSDLIRVTGQRGLMIVHWLVDQFLTPQESKIEQAVSMLAMVAGIMPEIRKAMSIIDEASRPIQNKKGRAA